ncbi:ankyrin repeat domain-containing protein [Denitrobaculum tricleocarpae]|uniref:Ankyrin repeat domain-containing protein n=1 Tax=Denitrobaculum tricleocarpae TaxID=2591009 RepID=A0A545TTF9_9PROT|nr:ankyrin repeat domain-containing protein [Denitrobaculum tricleocarpae]TQV80504.1 ankyrin repeat domain-containing protein [Denitrobaculum tricleocarpae]
MTRYGSLILALVGIALAGGTARAESRSHGITPYKPVLLENMRPAICDPFLSAWERVFYGEGLLDERLLDLQAAFPDAEFLTYPRDRHRAGYFNGLYDRSFVEFLDLDNDGKLEVLHIEGGQVGWRYLSSDIYVFENEARYQEIKAVYGERYPHYQFFHMSRMGRQDNDEPRPVVQHPPSSVVYVFSHEGAFYTTAAVSRWFQGNERQADLYRLKATGTAEKVCSVQLQPSASNIESFTENSRFYQTLQAILGGPQTGCRGGTRAWGISSERLLLTALNRPQSMALVNNYTINETMTLERQDAARKIRFLVWGVSDPTSWSLYNSFKNSRSAFIEGMRAYYLQHFVETAEEARALAEESYRFVVDQTISSDYPDRFRLTGIAQWPDFPLSLSRDTPPRDVAGVAIESWLEFASQNQRAASNSKVWRDAVLAAVFTRQDIDVVASLWTKLKESYRDDQAAIDKASNDVLLAALGDQDLTEFALMAGAQVDAPTNWFAKTALMYAAQTNDIGVVQFLLKQGANPSARTVASEHQCARLKRDGRTPLMYAAENASSEVIELLLSAGAQTAATDTEEHTAAWYLQRNSGLTDQEKTVLLRRLNPEP